MIITVIFAKPQWSSLKSQIIKDHAFELVHIGEEDERLDRREKWWNNNDVNDMKMCVCDIWYLGLNRTVAIARRGTGEGKSYKKVGYWPKQLPMHI